MIFSYNAASNNSASNNSENQIVETKPRNGKEYSDTRASDTNLYLLYNDVFYYKSDCSPEKYTNIVKAINNKNYDYDPNAVDYGAGAPLNQNFGGEDSPFQQGSNNTTNSANLISSANLATNAPPAAPAPEVIISLDFNNPAILHILNVHEIKSGVEAVDDYFLKSTDTLLKLGLDIYIKTTASGASQYTALEEAIRSIEKQRGTEDNKGGTVTNRACNAAFNLLLQNVFNFTKKQMDEAYNLRLQLKPLYENQRTALLNDKKGNPETYPIGVAAQLLTNVVTGASNIAYDNFVSTGKYSNNEEQTLREESKAFSFLATQTSTSAMRAARNAAAQKNK